MRHRNESKYISKFRRSNHLYSVCFYFFKTPVVAFLLKIYPEKSAPAAGFSASANVNSVAG